MRVLQLIGVLVEVLGADLSQYLGVVASALPQLWESSTGGASSSNTGAVVRLHSALIGLLTHLVSKLRAAAVTNAQVTDVMRVGSNYC